MGMLDDAKRVVLKNEREVYLDDENDISLSVIYNGETVRAFPIDYPRAGYGGGSLSLSPSEEYLLFSYYSGQSEEAFTLLRINDYLNFALELVYESGYLYGEAASYGFSPNETLLIQGLPSSCTLWDWKDYMEQGFAEKDEDGDLFFVYGCINILDIAKKEMSEHLIRVYPSVNSENFPEENYNPLMSPKMTNDNTLGLTMPWGEEKLVFPLGDAIIFKL